MKPVIGWQVQSGDGERVAEVLSKLPEAVRKGRVFVNGRRAEPSDRIEVGDRLEVWPRRSPPEQGGVTILAQRDGIVLASKPAGLPTETTRLGDDSVVSELIGQLNGGQVRAATRLDAMVSGVVVCLVGKDAARRVDKWRAMGQLRRSYLAIAKGSPSTDEGCPTTGEWSWSLARVRDRAGRHLARHGVPKARRALTRFELLASVADASLLRLVPETGRMHQLRCHASMAGLPLWGDRSYGGPHRLSDQQGSVVELDRVALHCFSVSLPALRAELPVPEKLLALWRSLGGQDADWGLGTSN